MQIRHGDLLIKSTEIPDGTKVRPDKVLAWGTATGHVHRVIGGQVLEGDSGKVYVRVTSTAGAQVVHTVGLTETLTGDHNTIGLPIGDYIVVRQRAYDPYERAIREVQD